MKKFSAILLLTILVFNLTGYRLLFNYLDGRAVADMVQQLDDNKYSAKGLIEVKIALHLPYTSNTRDFERYDGFFQLNGVAYNCLERKIVNDTLVMRCVPNTQENSYRHAESEYARSVNDLQSANGGHKSNNASLLIKGLIFVYNSQFAQWHVPGLPGELRVYKTSAEKIPVDVFSRTPGQPPEAA